MSGGERARVGRASLSYVLSCLYRLYTRFPTTAAESIVFMASDDFTQTLVELGSLLENLPSVLPLAKASDESRYSIFLPNRWVLDKDLMEKIEDEVGVMNEQFKQVFGWKTRSTGDGIISIEERGPAICGVVDILRCFHDKYPGNGVVIKWGTDVLEGARKVYETHGVDVPSVRHFSYKSQCYS